MIQQEDSRSSSKLKPTDDVNESTKYVIIDAKFNKDQLGSSEPATMACVPYREVA